MLIGGETGGECTSDVHVREANSGMTAIADNCGSGWTRTDTGCFEVTSDELLIAGR